MASAVAVSADETTEVGVLRGRDADGPRRPLQVMHVVYTLRPGGMEFGVVKLVNGLNRARIRSSICSTLPASADMRGRVAADVPVFDLQRRPGTDLRVVRDLYRLFRRERPDLVHTHAWGTLVEGLLAARLARIPCVVHGEHGTLQLRGYQRRIQRWGWGQTDQVVCVSRMLAKRMAESTGFSASRIRAIQNGVDLARFGQTSRLAARAALGLPPESVVIGTAGRLVPVKDQANLIEAMAIARARTPFIGVIAGDGPLRQELEALIAARNLTGDVRILGHRDDIENVYAAIDVFALSSRSEGMSNTILEAMASGVAVVATAVGGAEELIDDGRTGVLVAAQDSAALANALAQVASDPELRLRLGGEARRKIERDFSLDQMLQNYEAMYLEVGGGLRRDAVAG